MSESQYLRNFALCLVFGLCGMHGSHALAQRPNFSPDGFFRMLDRNQDGKVDADEASRIPGPFRESLERSGVDLRRGVDAQQFGRVMDQMRQERERNGGGPSMFGGPPGGGDRRDSDRSDPGRGDSGRGSEEDRRREYERRREEEQRRNDPAKPAAPSVPKIVPLKPKERVTIDLPQTFTAGDTDLDGQISLFEWRQWKRGALDEFNSYDADGDGFLTPRELKNGPTNTQAKQQVVIVNAAAPSGPAAGAVTLNSSRTATAAAASTPTSTSDADPNSVAYKRGESMFRILDRNRDGAVNPEEWSASSRLKPMFEKAALDLSRPMPKETFLSHYVKLSEAGS